MLGWRWVIAVSLCAGVAAAQANGPVDPYYPNRHLAKLTTERWVGEEGVRAVVILAIDDMREHHKYEAYLRPILERLKRIDGRAPVSIMTNRVNPELEHVRRWLKEGLSLETHSFDHPCPLLAGGDFAKAKGTYDRCVDLLASVPGNAPVAFRVPCCDSLNTPSPRFYSEIFNQVTPGGKFLVADSSVFNVTTASDPELPRELVLDADGRERFRKYVPKDRSFVNWIEDYPYPYVIGRLGWQFPCATPSDWQAQFLHKPNNPRTVEDWKALLDATAIKRGTMTMVFHPHGWIKAEQVVELIDHAAAKHGGAVKFLTFKEAVDRLDANFLKGRPLRNEKGGDNGVRVRDVDGDGLMDVEHLPPGEERRAVPVDMKLPEGTAFDAAARFVDLNDDGLLDLLYSSPTHSGVYLNVGPGKGWRDLKVKIPLIVRADGSDNGMFVHSRHLWWQNEDTAALPNHVDRRSFADLLKGVEPTALSPEQSLQAIQVRPGFVVELVAAEPLVTDPIAIAFGPDGKLWVVEMGDYPLGAGALDKPGGRVRYLEDPDGDGRYEKSTLFLDGLSYPTGVMPWKNGVLVTAAPEIFYAEDTDGDGKADKREVLFEGFVKGNQQHRVNGLLWGMDNWVYGANGDSGGKVRSVRTGKEVSISGRDFRFRPDTGAFEAEAGQSQFGIAFDDFGERFGCNNFNPLFHYVVPERYARRNPHVAVSRAVVSPTTVAERRVYPASRTMERFNDPHTLNHFTSACSVHVYRDDLFGPHFAGDAFVCEPVHNLVGRMRLRPSGASFAVSRAPGEESSEFLASRDNWFRPTMVRTGPDGCLYVVDMYRHVIEHPQWIPKDAQARLDLRAGHDKGRIYRVRPVHVKPRAMPRLDRMDAAELAAAIDSPSGWQRDVAQQLIVSGGLKEAAAKLRELVAQAKSPAVRSQAMWTLDGLGMLDDETLRVGFSAEDRRQRRQAIRLAEGRQALRQHSGEALNHDDARVRMQIAWNAADAPELLPTLLRDPDGHVREAALTSLNRENIVGVVGAWTEGSAMLTAIIRTAVGFGESKAIAPLLGRAIRTGRDGQLADVLDALGSANLSPRSILPDADLAPRLAGARKRLADESAPLADRASAARLLCRERERMADDLRQLAAMLSPRTPPELAAAAVGAMGRSGEASVAPLVLERWPSASPALRAQVAGVLLSRPAWNGALLDAIEAGKVRPTELDASVRQRLVQAQDAKLRERAERLLADVVSPDRQTVLDRHADVARMNGDAARGRLVFEKLCASCHRYGDLGQPIGPDLAVLPDKSPESLLLSILDPNRAVEPRYAGYLIETRGGDALGGILSAETATSVTLLAPNLPPQTLLRSDIKSIRSTGVSLMPEGLEAGQTRQDLADLLAFIRSAR